MKIHRSLLKRRFLDVKLSVFWRGKTRNFFHPSQTIVKRNSSLIQKVEPIRMAIEQEGLAVNITEIAARMFDIKSMKKAI